MELISIVTYSLYFFFEVFFAFFAGAFFVAMDSHPLSQIDLVSGILQLFIQAIRRLLKSVSSELVPGAGRLPTAVPMSGTGHAIKYAGGFHAPGGPTPGTAV